MGCSGNLEAKNWFQIPLQLDPPSKLVSLCGSPQLPPWYSNINHGYKPHTMVAKRDTTERPHILKTTRMIIQTVVAEGFVCEQNEAWEQL